MNKQQPIGVIDSGVGGLTVLRRLQELMPHEPFHLFGRYAQYALWQPVP